MPDRRDPALGACKGTPFVVGSWLFVDDQGKPGACHTFTKKRKLIVYAGAACKGPKDDLASGRWQMKVETKMAIQRGQEKIAQLAMITDRKPDRFVSRGTIAGTMYKVGKAGGEALLAELKKKGVIKVFPLPKALGCGQLDTKLAQIRALPKEENPRMLRARDQGLEYRVDKKAGDPKVAKVVFALNQEQLDWVYIEATEAAFAAPGPEARLEDLLGKPFAQVSTGKGQKRQNVLMWKTYCKKLKGQANRDIDLTLFVTTGEKKAYYYLSEGVVSNIWENLRQMANDPNAQAPDEDKTDGDAAGGDKAGGDKAGKGKNKAVKAPKKAAAPKAAKAPAKAPKKAAPTKAAAKAKPGKAKAGTTAGGRPVVSGSDEDI